MARARDDVDARARLRGNFGGERDEFGTVEDLRALASQLPPEADTQVRVIPGAGHFFDEQLEELTRAVREWAEQRLGGPAAG